MKKKLSIALILILILYTFTPSMAINNKSYEEAALILKEAGALQEMRLEEKLKRQDMVVMVSRLFKEEESAKNYKGKHDFQDIKDKYYDPYIAWAVNKGLIEGTSPNVFGYDKNVRVQEFQTVLLRALDYKEEASNWAKVPDISQNLKLMDGTSEGPKEEMSRGLMAKMTVNALNHTLMGSSITLAQKLDINISTPLIVEGNAIIEKDTFKYEGNAPDIKSLKLGLKLISEKDEKTYDIKLDPQGKFTVEIPNLDVGKYEYRFISQDKNTIPETFTITPPNTDKV